MKVREKAMTKFIKSEFSKGVYVTYQNKFVAKFKYNRSERGSFLSFLCKNFTVEEYFSRLDAGESPLAILESRGYVLPHIKKRLLESGYAPTQDGFKLYIDAEVRATQARLRAAS